MRALVVAMGLSLSAAPAFAECAWVLWRNDPRPVEGRPGYVWPQWQIVDAFTGMGGNIGPMMAQSKCEDRKKQEALALPAKSRTELSCLPDTIDPRGPKGR